MLVVCAVLTVSGAVSSMSTGALAAAPPSATVALGYTSGRHVVSFSAAGIRRTAVLVVPSDVTKAAPLVFAFHGHGGSGAGLERKFKIEQFWPAAIVVYPDGLTGHKGRTDPEGKKPGWQTMVGEDGDRDLAFYDMMLTTLRSKLHVDVNRLYVVGHSNGSAFTSLLLNQRGSAIAATANSSSQPSASQLAGDPVRSMFMSMGTHDPLVPYENQRKAIPIAEHKLGIDASKTTKRGYLRMEHGRGNLELDTYVHPGGHATPAGVPRLIVEFFRRHTLSAG
jgi:polyhydroxybutyrate depolymerase